MTTATLDNPAAVEERLAEIENELAERQNRFEEAALLWFRLKKERERVEVEAWVKAEGTVAERNNEAKRAALGLVYATSNGPEDAWKAEGAYEAQKAAVRVLEARASIGMALLKAQSRIS